MKNVGFLQIIYSKKDIAVVEVLKRFFRFVGLLCWKTPVLKRVYEKYYINKYKQQEGLYHIVMHYNMDMQSKSFFEVNKNRNVVYVDYMGIPESGQRSEFFQDMLEKLIDSIWEDSSNVAIQLKRIATLYIEYNMFTFMQSARSLRSIRPAEVIATDRKKGKVPVEVETSNFLAMMTISCHKVQNILETEFSDNSSPYVRYAKFSLSVMTNDLYQLLERLPIIDLEYLISFKSHKGNPLFNEEDVIINYIDQYSLLWRLWGKANDDTLPSYNFLSSIFCYSETALENYGLKYQRKFIASTRKIPVISSIVYYRYADYISKARNDWDAGIIFYKKALETNPLCYPAQYNISVYNTKRNYYEGAIAEGIKAVDIIVQQIGCGYNPENSKDPIGLRELEFLFKVYNYIYLCAKNSLDSKTLPERARYAMRLVYKSYLRNDIMNTILDDGQFKEWYMSYYQNSNPVKIMKKRMG